VGGAIHILIHSLVCGLPLNLRVWCGGGLKTVSAYKRFQMVLTVSVSILFAHRGKQFINRFKWFKPFRA
jgi:hypothetical protein